MRKILIAPTAFKGTLSPLAVAQAIEAGVIAYFDASREEFELDIVPIADGGDGTIECVAQFLPDAEIRHDECSGALGQSLKYQWLKIGDAALIELAGCCGIGHLLSAEPPLSLAPLDAHTYGLGQAVRKAVEAGCREINIAVGGSASTDAGVGALRALGATFFDANGVEMIALGGAANASIYSANLAMLQELIGATKIRVLTDVINPLLGPNGAAHIFAPQKGANKMQVVELDAALRQIADVLEAATNRHRRDQEGAGAAGGTAFGFATALNAEIVSGFAWVAEKANLASRIAQTDVVITGEGRFDAQSLNGKAVGQIISVAESFQKRILVVSGCLGSDLPPLSHMLVVPKASTAGFCGSKEIGLEIRVALPQIFHE